MIPKAMKGRPMQGPYPVPWFATHKDESGRYDFTKVTVERRDEALRRNVCWVSGEPMGKWFTFILTNPDEGVTVEPPMKHDVAKWALKACPFMAHGIINHKAAERNGLERTPPEAFYLYVTDSYEYEEGGPITLGRRSSLYEWKNGQLSEI